MDSCQIYLHTRVNLLAPPTQKPLALYERIVLASSNKGDLVLDPFAGYATTLIAARNHGRRWVGAERRPDARHHVVCRMLGIKAQEAEKARQNTLYGDWITARLAELETHYRTEAPTRTDEGDAAAPFLTHRPDEGLHCGNLRATVLGMRTSRHQTKGISNWTTRTPRGTAAQTT